MRVHVRFDRFHAGEILQLITKYQITTLCSRRPFTPHETGRLRAIDLSSSNTPHCGEALNPISSIGGREATGLTIFEGFGQTETPLTIGT
jgi:acetyl-CoA synthetase